MSLPRIDSRSPLQGPPSFPDHKLSSSSSASFLPAAFLNALHPRKAKYRTTFVGLLFVVFISTYIFLAHGMSLSPVLSLRRADPPVANQLDVARESIQNSRVQPAAVPEAVAELPVAPVAHKHDTPSFHKGKGRYRLNQRPALKLTPEEELAAVSFFIASLPQNVIPHTVDPAQPIDPQLVLDFDTRSPRASDEVKHLVADVWSRNPVFVYSKLYSPVSREVKSILADLYLKPVPTIVDVDMRDDADLLKPMLTRLTGIEDLPIVIVGGKILGSVEEIRELAKDQSLAKAVTEAGAVVNGSKKKKGKK